MRGKAGSTTGEDIGEIESCIVRTQFDKQIKRFREHVLGPGVRAIDLVHHNDWLQADFQGLLQNEPSLWPRAFEGVDQYQTAVSHLQHSLDFTTEVGVAWSIDNIDFRAHVIERDVLGEDRNPAFAFQIV